jgi:site-specific DNA recombinase
VDPDDLRRVRGAAIDQLVAGGTPSTWSQVAEVSAESQLEPCDDWAEVLVQAAAFAHVRGSPGCRGYTTWSSGRAGCGRCSWGMSARMDEAGAPGSARFAQAALGRAKVEGYAALFDLDLVAVEVDAGESAKSLARPALGRALAMLRTGKADALLVVKLDRLTRSVRDLCDLVDDYFRDGKHALLSVGEQVDTRSAAGRMVLNMLTVIGQWEREAIGERTSAAMQHKASQGEYIGGAAPYGYALAADGVTLVEVATEQAVIAEARAFRATGLSLRKVVEELDRKGLRARNGRTFAPAQIARMVEG